MASDSESAFSSDPSASSFIETLTNSRNRDISLFLPFILGLNAASPLQETESQGSPRESRDRIILINPFTQNMVVIERNISNISPLGFDSLLNGLISSKNGRPPASKASIDAMESVEIGKDDEQCVICLEGWEIGEKAKEMHCKHKFHGECIEKWLKIHGSCPVCRYEMPVEDENGDGKMRDGEGDGDRRRGIWVGFAFSRDVSNVRTGSSDLVSSDQEVQQV